MTDAATSEVPPVVAVDVGGTTVKGALASPDGTLFARRRLVVADIERDEVVPAVLDLVTELVGRARTECGDVRGIGLAVPGVVDEVAGVGDSSMILGWRQVPFVRLLAEHGLPVAFSHDVAAGAYAESRRGAAVGHSDWLFLALGTGLGSTFVLDGRPYRGSARMGGELAHVVARPDGPLCRCGKHGCLEMIATGPGVAASYVRRGGDGAEEVVTAAQVASRAADGDPLALSVLEEAAAALSDVVAGYVESMNPSVVVVGGGLSQAGALFFGPLSERLVERIAFARPRPAVVPAAFGADAALVGVATAAHEHAQSGRGGYVAPFACADARPFEQLP